MTETLDKIQYLENCITQTRHKLKKAHNSHAWNDEEHNERQNELYSKILLLQSRHQELTVSLSELRKKWDMDLCDWSQEARRVDIDTPIGPPNISHVIEKMDSI